MGDIASCALSNLCVSYTLVSLSERPGFAPCVGSCVRIGRRAVQKRESRDSRLHCTQTALHCTALHAGVH